MALQRTGTTYLMRLLASTPRIVAHESYPLEFRPYQLSLFGVNSVFPDAEHVRSKHYRFPDDEMFLYSPFAAQGYLTKSQAFALYQHLAQLAAKDARYFAEKSGPRRDMGIIAAGDPDTRIIFPLRDPRDVFLSQRAFNRRNDSVSDWMNGHEPLYRQLIERLDTPLKSINVRFEALVERPQPVLAELLAWLDLPNDEATVQAAVDRAKSMEGGRHLTAASPGQSVGRWRAELSAAEREAFATRFRYILEGLSYPLA